MIRRLALATALSLGLALPAAADFSQGAAALQSGDYATAYREFLALAERGHQDAQFALGKMYRSGAGVTQDDAEAFAWFRRAAEHGHAGAQNVVGYLYTKGVGTELDYFQAYFWFSLAATQSNTGAAANRDEVAPFLSAVRRAEADGLVAQRRQQAKALGGGFGLPEPPPVEAEPAAPVAAAAPPTEADDAPPTSEVAAVPPAEPEAPTVAVAEAASAPVAPAAEIAEAIPEPPAAAAIAAVPPAEPEVPAAAVAEVASAPEAPAAEVVAAIPEPPAAAATSPPPDGFQVQLGAFRVPENAPAEWRRLQRAEADLLGGLEHWIRRLNLGDQGVLHLLRAGPLADSEAAGALCRALAERGVDCLVIAP